MKRNRQRGSAVVELAIAAWIVAILIVATEQFFMTIEPANREAVAVRTEAFRQLEEDRPGWPGCGGIQDIFDGNNDMQIQIPGNRYGVSAWFGHKRNLYSGC